MSITAINARNQFKGTVQEIIHASPLMLSEVDVQTPAGMITSITTRSIDALDLRVKPVLAVFKSTR